MELNMDDIFSGEGLNIFCVGNNAGTETVHNTFKSHFGCSVKVCVAAWDHMTKLNVLPDTAEPKHLLWLLLWLRNYLKLELICSMCRCSKPIFIKWRDAITYALSEMDMVSQK